jgi:hypothetical protein
MRVPRLARLAWRIFVDADLNGRFAVEMFVSVFMFILGTALFCLYKLLAALVLLPQRWRASPPRRIRLAARERSAARDDGREIEYPPPLIDVLGDIHLFDVVAGGVGFVMCFVFVLAFMMQVEDFLPRKGPFGGAGVTVVWPMAPVAAPR